MILDFVTALTDQLDQGVPIETVRDFLQLNFGSQWEQEVSTKKPILKNRLLIPKFVVSAH